MIARAIACLLLVTQLGFVVQPALSSLAGGRESECTMMAEHDGRIAPHGSPAFEAPRDCDACQIPGCLNMHACSIRGPAVVPGCDRIPTGFLLSEARHEAVDSEAGLLTTPIPPPPKA